MDVNKTSIKIHFEDCRMENNEFRTEHVHSSCVSVLYRVYAKKKSSFDEKKVIFMFMYVHVVYVIIL